MNQEVCLLCQACGSDKRGGKSGSEQAVGAAAASRTCVRRNEVSMVSQLLSRGLRQVQPGAAEHHACMPRSSPRRPCLRLPGVGLRLLLRRRLRVCQCCQRHQVLLQLLLVPGCKDRQVVLALFDGLQCKKPACSNHTPQGWALHWQRAQFVQCTHSMHSFSLPRFWFSTIAAISFAFSSSICKQEEQGSALSLRRRWCAAAAAAPPPWCCAQRRCEQ